MPMSREFQFILRSELKAISVHLIALVETLVVVIEVSAPNEEQSVGRGEDSLEVVGEVGGRDCCALEQLLILKFKFIDELGISLEDEESFAEVDVAYHVVRLEELLLILHVVVLVILHEVAFMSGLVAFDD